MPLILRLNARLAPSKYISGSSIPGKLRIYKRGGKILRDVLYMCAMNTMKTNPACIAFASDCGLMAKLESKGFSGNE